MHLAARAEKVEVTNQLLNDFYQSLITKLQASCGLKGEVKVTHRAEFDWISY
jgi:hypothetical protein